MFSPQPIFTDEGTVRIMFPPLGKGFVYGVNEDEVLKKIVLDRAPLYHFSSSQSLENQVIPPAHRTFDHFRQRYEEERIDALEQIALLGSDGKELKPERQTLASRIDEIQGLELSVTLVPYSIVPTDYAREPEQRFLNPNGDLTKNIPENIFPPFLEGREMKWSPQMYSGEEGAYTMVIESLLHHLPLQQVKHRKWATFGLQVQRNIGYQGHGLNAIIHDPRQERLHRAGYPFRILVDEFFKEEKVQETLIAAAQLVYAGTKVEYLAQTLTAPSPKGEEREEGKEREEGEKRAERKKRGVSAPDFILQQAQELYTKADQLLSTIPPPQTGLEQFLIGIG
ncbi:MAG: hypothetical protein AABX13_01675 [Nanoarchaeota archaeon]